MKIEDAFKILIKYDDELKRAPCSKDYHLNIIGGLKIHLDNVTNVAEKYFKDDETVISLAMIHDIGKARTYKIKENKTVDYNTPSINHVLWTIIMIVEYGYKLTPEELNALQFHHGGYSNYKGNMNELAVKLHFCDMMATINE